MDGAVVGWKGQIKVGLFGIGPRKDGVGKRCRRG